MVIYIDLLAVTNAVAAIIYLETLGLIVHRQISCLRLFFACVIGGAFSLIILMNGNTYPRAILITLLKFAGVVLTLAVSFKFKSVKEFFSYLALYLTVRLIYLGLTLVFWQLSKTKIIYVKNYTFYFNISLSKLVLSVAGAYAAISLWEFISRQCADKSDSYSAVYNIGDYIVKLPAVADSGNKLCDSFTGIPVVIFYCSEMYSHFRLDECYDNLNGFRLIPFSTVNGGGLIPVTQKGTVTIIDEKENKRQVKCCVGILNSENQTARAIFNPALIK